jgi:hypothetical protein
MKILFLTNRLPHADVVGGHRLIYQRMEQLKNRGHWIGIAALVMNENRQHLAQLQSQFDFAQAIPYQNPSFTRRLLNDYLNPILPAIFWKKPLFCHDATCWNGSAAISMRFSRGRI